MKCPDCKSEEIEEDRMCKVIGQVFVCMDCGTRGNEKLFQQKEGTNE